MALLLEALLLLDDELLGAELGTELLVATELEGLLLEVEATDDGTELLLELAGLLEDDAPPPTIP